MDRPEPLVILVGVSIAGGLMIAWMLFSDIQSLALHHVDSEAIRALVEQEQQIRPLEMLIDRLEVETHELTERVNALAVMLGIE